MCQCIHRLSICLSQYLLLNHWAEFNQTCYITSPHGKGVWEQHFFFPICLSGICPSYNLLLNHWAQFNQTCYMPSPHGKGVAEQVHLSVMLLATLATSVGICNGTPSTAHSSIFFIRPENIYIFFKAKKNHIVFCFFVCFLKQKNHIFFSVFFAFKESSVSEFVCIHYCTAVVKSSVEALKYLSTLL